MKKLFEEHQTVASILSIVVAVGSMNAIMQRGLKEDINIFKEEMRAMNRRIDHMYEIMIKHITGETK